MTVLIVGQRVICSIPVGLREAGETDSMRGEIVGPGYRADQVKVKLDDGYKAVQILHESFVHVDHTNSGDVITGGGR